MIYYPTGGLMDQTLGLSAGISRVHQRGGLMDKSLGLSAGRSRVRIPGRGKCSVRTTAVDAMVNYPLYLLIYYEA